MTPLIPLVLYLVIGGAIFAILEHRWKKELGWGDNTSADYRSLQIVISLGWLPLILLGIIISPAYFSYLLVTHLISNNDKEKGVRD